MLLKIKDKKSEIMSEYPVIFASIVVTGLVLFFINNMIVASNEDYLELNPELSYEFPLVFVHSFLFMPIEKKDKTLFIKSENLNLVKDLIWLNTKASKKLLEEYRKKYIKKNLNIIKSPNIFKLYKEFSNDNFDNKDLLNIKYEYIKNQRIRSYDIKNYVSKYDILIPIQTRTKTITAISFY